MMWQEDGPQRSSLSNLPPLSDHEKSLRPVPAEEHSTQRSLNGQGLKHKGESSDHSLEAPRDLTTQCHRCSGGAPRTGKGHAGGP